MTRPANDARRLWEVKAFASELRFLSLIALLVGAGCASLLVESYRYGTIAVEVTTPDGTGVPGVELMLYRSSQDLAYGLTGPNGRHEFALVPFGSLGVIARVPDGFSAPDGLTWLYADGLWMEVGAHMSVQLTIHRCEGTIRVRVVDDGGTPLGDVRVWVYGGPTILVEMRTDLDGRVRFDDLPCGDLGVTLEAPTGYVLRPGRGGTYMDGRMFGAAEMEVVFTIDRVRG